MLWHNMREEPVLYINGKPYVVRESSDPFHNLEYTGAFSIGPDCRGQQSNLTSQQHAYARMRVNDCMLQLVYDSSTNAWTAAKQCKIHTQASTGAGSRPWSCD